MKSMACCINDLGEIVGVILTNTERHIFVLRQGGFSDLGKIDDYPHLGGMGKVVYDPGVSINNASQITSRLTTQDGNQRSFIQTRGQTAYFGLLRNGNVLSAQVINNRGQVAGQIFTADRSQAFIALNGVVTELPSLRGRRSSANCINDRGTVVGWAYAGEGAMELKHAMLWENGNMRDLNISDGRSSDADCINSSGQIVGWGCTGDGQCSAYLWEGNEALNLNDLVAPGSDWHLLGAYLINGRGQIVAGGAKGKLRHVFLLSPSNAVLELPKPAAVVEDASKNQVSAVPTFNLTSFVQLPGGAFRLSLRAGLMENISWRLPQIWLTGTSWDRH